MSDLPDMYAVSAVHNGRQLPTFYLLTNVQGIVSEAHAAEIAARIVPVGSDICVAATSFHAHRSDAVWLEPDERTP
jgi:hypothetical protein